MLGRALIPILRRNSHEKAPDTNYNFKRFGVGDPLRSDQFRTIDGAQGYASVTDLAKCIGMQVLQASETEIHEEAEHGERYTRIQFKGIYYLKCNTGHAEGTDIEPGEPFTPEHVLWPSDGRIKHSTHQSVLDSIFSKALLRQGRSHVHFSLTEEGTRKTKNVDAVVIVNIDKAHLDGMHFRTIAEQNIVLTPGYTPYGTQSKHNRSSDTVVREFPLQEDGVPPRYILQVYDLYTKRVIFGIGAPEGMKTLPNGMKFIASTLQSEALF